MELIKNDSINSIKKSNITLINNFEYFNKYIKEISN